MGNDGFTEAFPEIDEVIAKMIQGEMERQHGALPAQVTKYDAEKAVVTAEPLVLVVVDGSAERLPPIQEVQIRWPAGSGWSIVGELQVGDVGWLRPAGADLSNWKASGAKHAPPLRSTRNSLSDVVFEPGSRPLSLPLAADQHLAGALVLWVESLLALGGADASSFVALGDKIFAELQSIANHVHPAGALLDGTGAPCTGSTGSATYSAPSSASEIQAEKVKAK